MSERQHFEAVERFTAATEGRPGERTFYLQVQAGTAVVTVKCEKQQVGTLGEYLSRILGGLPEPDALPDPDALEPLTPLLPAFVVGTISVAFDEADDRFVVELEEIVAAGEEGEEGEAKPETAPEQGSVVVRLTRGQARAFASRARPRSWPPAGRPAGSVACRSTPRVISAPA